MTKAQKRVLLAAKRCVDEKGWAFQLAPDERHPDTAFISAKHFRALENAVAALKGKD